MEDRRRKNERVTSRCPFQVRPSSREMKSKAKFSRDTPCHYTPY